MKKLLYLVVPSIALIIFIIWTVLVKIVDVTYIQDIGFLGFYHFNTEVNDFVVTLNNSLFHKVTNVLLILALVSIIPFAVIGVVQLVKRKSLKKVDIILYELLGGYVAIAFLYFIFEIVKINFSPLSTAEELKASYPSSHVFITISVLLINFVGLLHYVKMPKFAVIACGCVVLALCVLAVIFRLFSGHHYFTDIDRKSVV